MLVKRLLVAAVLLPTGLLIIRAGGVIYVAFISLILLLAGWEYVQLFRQGGHQPCLPLVLAAILALVWGRWTNAFTSSEWILSALVLGAMTWHLVSYERGRDQAATDFAVTLAGGLYLGWAGAYFISLRELPEGLWWLLVVLPAVWLADTAAFFVGTRWGRHRLAPRLSPKKSWEGFWAGVVFSPILTALLAWLWQFAAGPATAITPWRAAIVALILSLLTPLGDLGESMLKRQFGVKDSSHILPGHGGVLDRIDSWLWGAVIGYYLVLWLV